MTVKELINILLDYNMDAEIKAGTKERHIDERGNECSGYMFDIYRVARFNKDLVEIVFDDWRKERRWLKK